VYQVVKNYLGLHFCPSQNEADPDPGAAAPEGNPANVKNQYQSRIYP
jgi:hypothetical protein